jgi:hypothetical protein
LLHVGQVAALGRGDHAVGLGAPLGAVDGALLGAQPGGFAVGELAAGHALGDALVLVGFVRIDARGGHVRLGGDAGKGKDDRGEGGLGEGVHGSSWVGMRLGCRGLRWQACVAPAQRGPPGRR